METSIMRVYTNKENAATSGGLLKAVLVAAVSIGLMTTGALAQSSAPLGPGQANQDSAADSQVQEELLHVQQELQQVESRIKEIEKKAMQTEELQQAQTEYYGVLREAAIASAPEVEGKFERQDKLIEELKGNPELQKAAAERSPEINEKIGEFQQLRNEITPVVQSVARQPELQQKQAEFEETMVEEMKEVDPQTDELLAQRAELFGRYEKLARRAQ